MESSSEITKTAITLEDRIIHYSLPDLQEYVETEFSSKKGTREAVGQSEINTIFKKKKKKKKIDKNDK